MTESGNRPRTLIVATEPGGRRFTIVDDRSRIPDPAWHTTEIKYIPNEELIGILKVIPGYVFEVDTREGYWHSEGKSRDDRS